MENDSSGAAEMTDGVIYYRPNFETDDFIQLDFKAIYEDIFVAGSLDPLQFGSGTLTF